MKILFITTHIDGTDGWSRYSELLIAEVKAMGHEVLVLTQKDGLRAPDKYILNPLSCIQSAKLMHEKMKSFHTEVIHILVEPYANILPFVEVPKTARVVITMHGTYSYAPNLFTNPLKKIFARLLLKKSLKKVDTIIAVSNFTKNYFLNNIKLQDIPEIKVVSNGVVIPEKLEVSKSEIPQILFVGGVKARKGIREALYALRVYKNKYSKDFRYVVVGSFDPNDSYYKDLRKLVKDFGLESQVEFRGRVGEEELERHYRSSHVFMLLLPQEIANKFEGFGFVYLEASARGLQVLGSPSGGASEAIEVGKSGLVVDSSASEKVADTLNRLVREPLSQEDCRAWAEENRIEKKALEILNLYRVL